VLIGLGELRFWELLVFAVVFGTFDALFMPAIAAITPEIVPEDLLPAMNAVRPLANNLVGNMLGPAVGGVLSGISYSLAIGVDSATFVVSAFALVFMRPTPVPVGTEGTSMLDEIRLGLRYVRKTTWIWTTLVSVSLINAGVFVPMSVLIPYFLRHVLHSSQVDVGYSFAVFGLAGTLGALIAGNLKTPKHRVRITWIYWVVGVLAAVIMGVATNLWEVLLFPIIASPMMILGNVIWESMMQKEVPRELLGRVSSVDWFLSLGLAPLGLIFSGELARYFGVRDYFVVASIVTSIPGFIIMASRRINAIDR
jgi:MFS family permease